MWCPVTLLSSVHMFPYSIYPHSNSTVHSTLKRRAGYISFDPPSVQLLRLVYKIEFAPLYQSMKTKDQKLAEIKGLARRAAQRFFSVFIFLQFGGKNLLKKLCQ